MLNVILFNVILLNLMAFWLKNVNLMHGLAEHAIMHLKANQKFERKTIFQKMGKFKKFLAVLALS
jgi:hypothetical protein